jgi:hypothetical protein
MMMLMTVIMYTVNKVKRAVIIWHMFLPSKGIKMHKEFLVAASKLIIRYDADGIRLQSS